jgi:hypothetical protein
VICLLLFVGNELGSNLYFLHRNDDNYFEVSKKIKEKFDNGEEYNKLHGSPLYLPANAIDRPDLKFIQWHNEKRYKE